MINIWGRRNSSNVQKVMWIMAELGLEYKRHTLGGTFGGLDTEEYKKLNPNSKIPVIDDDGFILWESNSIVRYLAQKHSEGNLWPSDPHKRALADQWMDWMLPEVGMDSMVVFFGLVRVPPEQQNKEAIEASAQKLGQTYSILDRYLASNDYIAGDAFSMGDIPLGVNLNRYYNLDVKHADLPHIKAWFERLQQRPAFQEHVGFPFGSNFDEWVKLEKEGR